MNALGDFRPDTLIAAYAHADLCYPEECCGLILAGGRYRRATNIQNQLHAAQPEVYTRDARQGYTLSPGDLHLLRDSREEGAVPVVAIVHSHPDAGAYFSEEDERKALYCGEPIHDADYLVIDTRRGWSRGAKLFRYDGTRFACVALFGADGTLTDSGGLDAATLSRSL